MPKGDDGVSKARGLKGVHGGKNLRGPLESQVGWKQRRKERTQPLFQNGLVWRSSWQGVYGRGVEQSSGGQEVQGGSAGGSSASASMSVMDIF